MSDYDIPACKRDKNISIETEDTETDSDKKYEKSAFISLITSPNYKMAIIIFILFIFLMSNMFIEMVLAKISSSLVEGNNPTSKGIIILGSMLAILYLLLEMLNTGGII